ncbi:MAG: tetratricopeptide repeat protein [Pirellulales bacterium]
MEAGKANEAIARAEALIAELEKANGASSEDLRWIGGVYEHNKDVDEAEEAFRKAAKKNPEDALSWLALVRHLATKRKIAEASDTIREAELALPEDRLPLFLAECYQAVGKVKFAERLYEEALDAYPNNVTILQAMAQMYLGARHPAKATEYLDALLAVKDVAKDNPTLVWARREKARLLGASREYPDFLAARELLAANYVDGKPVAADLAIEVGLLAQRPEFPYWREAIDKLVALSKQRVLSPPLQATLAELYDKVGDWDACRKVLYDLGGHEGRNPAYLAMIIDRFIAHNELKNAGPWLKKLEKVAPRSPETILRRARYLAKTGERDKATRLLEAMAPKAGADENLPPEQINLLLMVAGEFEQLGELNTAEDLYQRYVKVRPNQRIVLAHFLVRRPEAEKVDEGITVCDDASAEGAGLDNVLQTGSLAVRNSKVKLTPEQLEKIERWYRRAEQVHPDSVTVRMRLAEYRDLQGRTDDAVKVYQGILNELKLPAQQKTIVLNNLAFLMAVGGGDMDLALEYINEAIKLLGPRSDLLDTRGMIHWRRNDAPAAIQDLEQAVQGTTSWVKKFHLALAKSMADNWADAGKMLREIEALEPDLTELSPLERKVYNELREKIKERTKR